MKLENMVLRIDFTKTAKQRAASYDIIIGTKILTNAGSYLKKIENIGKKVFLVVNDKVYELYGSLVEKSLSNTGYKVHIAKVFDGEEAKSMQNAMKLYDAMFDAGIDRSCAVLALGGGVVGDLAGFVAATYMRGVPFIQLPTTLLAQVDSSVGGKVAVNHPMGKNIIGAFYQPMLVLTDIGVLKTLDDREILCGISEIIKSAIIRDKVFFNWLFENSKDVLALSPEALQYVIKTSCKIKADVVEADETEKSLRAILNFGHTVAHALETITSYGYYKHGEAVAIGMVVEANIAHMLGMIDKNEVKQVESIIKAFGLPAQIEKDINIKELLNLMYKDKKVLDDKLTFALINCIGSAVIKRNVPEDIILKALEQNKQKR